MLENDYPFLAALAKALIILPYSTGRVKSTFSEFRAFKTNYRNTLSLENVQASVLVEQNFKNNGLQILPEMKAKYFEMWKPKILEYSEPSLPTVISDKQQFPAVKIKEEINSNDKISELTAAASILSYMAPIAPILNAFFSKNLAENMDSSNE